MSPTHHITSPHPPNTSPQPPNRQQNCVCLYKENSHKHTRGITLILLFSHSIHRLPKAIKSLMRLICVHLARNEGAGPFGNSAPMQRLGGVVRLLRRCHHIPQETQKIFPSGSAGVIILGRIVPLAMTPNPFLAHLTTSLSPTARITHVRLFGCGLLMMRVCSRGLHSLERGSVLGVEVRARRWRPGGLAQIRIVVVSPVLHTDSRNELHQHTNDARKVSA